MPNTNIIILAGHIGKAPDLSRKPYHISIATTAEYKEKSRTLWHDVTVWEDGVLDNADKGDTAYVTGHINYTTKDEKKYTNIVADAIQIKKKKSKYNDEFMEE